MSTNRGGRAADDCRPPGTVSTHPHTLRKRPPFLNCCVGIFHLDLFRRRGGDVEVCINGKDLVVSLRVFVDANRFRQAAALQIGETIEFISPEDWAEAAIDLLVLWGLE